MSNCPSTHPISPFKKSISSEHTVSHRRKTSPWQFGACQKDHVIRLKSDQDLFQSVSLSRTRSKRIVGTVLEHAARHVRWPAIVSPTKQHHTIVFAVASKITTKFQKKKANNSCQWLMNFSHAHLMRWSNSTGIAFVR